MSLPSVQRIQRTMRIDSSVQVLDEQLLQSLKLYLQALEKVEGSASQDKGEGQTMSDEKPDRLKAHAKLLGRRAARNCIEVCEKGRCLQLWEVLADFIFAITK